MTLEEAFGQVLKDLRTQKDLSQMKLASAAKMDVSTISLFERGENKPNLQTVFLIAEALDTKPSALIKKVEALGLEF